MRGRSFGLGVVALALACNRPRPDDRRAEVERQVAEAEGAQAPAGGPEARPSRAPPAVTAESGRSSPPPEPPGVEVSAWASELARSIDTIDRRSRQLLSVALLRRAHDPRQKSQELVALMQWCDEGSPEACLRVGHALLFNECLFERARGYYQKAQGLMGSLPSAATDSFTIDGQPQRGELGAGLRFSDPANRDDPQVRSLASVCGAIAERDRPLWDEMFTRYESGELTPAAQASTGEEQVMLGVLRKRMLLEADERVEALERLHAGAGQALRLRLASAADGPCAEGDAASCATASFLHARRCDLARMQDAYRRYQSALPGLDAPARAQVVELARDVVATARAYSEGSDEVRATLLRSLCPAPRR